MLYWQIVSSFVAGCQPKLIAGTERTMDPSFFTSRGSEKRAVSVRAENEKQQNPGWIECSQCSQPENKIVGYAITINHTYPRIPFNYIAMSSLYLSTEMKNWLPPWWGQVKFVTVCLDTEPQNASEFINWVCHTCLKIGANPPMVYDDFPDQHVPFESSISKTNPAKWLAKNKQSISISLVVTTINNNQHTISTCLPELPTVMWPTTNSSSPERAGQLTPGPSGPHCAQLKTLLSISHYHGRHQLPWLPRPILPGAKTPRIQTSKYLKLLSLPKGFRNMVLPCGTPKPWVSVSLQKSI